MRPSDRDGIAGARVLVTGGAGLIGSHLVDRLQAMGAADIVVYDNLSRGTLANLAEARGRGRLTFVEADIRDRARLASACDGIDILYHLAAIRLTQCADEPRYALEVMAEGAFNVFDAAVRAGVGRVVSASSASVYGAADRFPIDESHHPYNDRTFYGAAKAYSEGLLRAFRDGHGLDYVALRPFNVYGPRMDVRGAYTEVLVRWMDAIDGGRRPRIFGDGRQSMDFVFVDDVARAFALAATRGIPGEVYNVATGVETSLTALAVALTRVMGSEAGIDYDRPRGEAPVPRRVAAIDKARRDLGFEASVTLNEGLTKLVAWWRAARGTVV